MYEIQTYTGIHQVCLLHKYFFWAIRIKNSKA